MDKPDLHEIEYAITETGFMCSGKSDVVTDRLDKLEAQCTDLFRQLRGARDRMAKMEEEHANEMESGRRGLIYRLDQLDARIAKMDEAHALDVTATDARLDRLSGIINEQETKFETRCRHLGEKADGAHTRIRVEGERISAANRLIMNECKEREAQLTAVLERLALENRAAGPTKPRSIKGGWANVYRHGQMNLHADKAAADTADSGRIACIRIPDFTEGEGL